MVKLINCYTGSVMYVAEDRVQEYLEAGHGQIVEAVPEKKPAKPAAKKRATKK